MADKKFTTEELKRLRRDLATTLGAADIAVYQDTYVDPEENYKHFIDEMTPSLKQVLGKKYDSMDKDDVLKGIHDKAVDRLMQNADKKEEIRVSCLFAGTGDGGESDLGVKRMLNEFIGKNDLKNLSVSEQMKRLDEAKEKGLREALVNPEKAPKEFLKGGYLEAGVQNLMSRAGASKYDMGVMEVGLTTMGYMRKADNNTQDSIHDADGRGDTQTQMALNFFLKDYNKRNGTEISADPAKNPKGADDIMQAMKHEFGRRVEEAANKREAIVPTGNAEKGVPPMSPRQILAFNAHMAIRNHTALTPKAEWTLGNQGDLANMVDKANRATIPAGLTADLSDLKNREKIFKYIERKDKYSVEAVTNFVDYMTKPDEDYPQGVFGRRKGAEVSGTSDSTAEAKTETTTPNSSTATKPAVTATTTAASTTQTAADSSETAPAATAAALTLPGGRFSTYHIERGNALERNTREFVDLDALNGEKFSVLPYTVGGKQNPDYFRIDVMNKDGVGYKASHILKISDLPKDAQPGILEAIGLAKPVAPASAAPAAAATTADQKPYPDVKSDDLPGTNTTAVPTLNVEPKPEIPVAAKPLRDVNIAKMQMCLKTLGHDPGKIDGFMGPNTQKGLESFANKEGFTLPETGDLLSREQAASLRDKAKASLESLYNKDPKAFLAKMEDLHRDAASSGSGKSFNPKTLELQMMIKTVAPDTLGKYGIDGKFGSESKDGYEKSIEKLKAAITASPEKTTKEKMSEGLKVDGSQHAVISSEFQKGARNWGFMFPTLFTSMAPPKQEAVASKGRGASGTWEEERTVDTEKKKTPNDDRVTMNTVGSGLGGGPGV